MRYCLSSFVLAGVGEGCNSELHTEAIIMDTLYNDECRNEKNFHFYAMSTSSYFVCLCNSVLLLFFFSKVLSCKLADRLELTSQSRVYTLKFYVHLGILNKCNDI